VTGGERRGFSGDGAAVERLRRWRSRAEEEEGSGEGTEWGVGARGGVLTRLSWSAAARPTPAYGRHVAGAGWSEAGAARGRERGGEAGRAAWLGRKGGGSAQQRLSPFSFFLNFFFSKMV